MDASANPVAVWMFFGVIALTLAITYWAAKRSRSASQLYAAGGQIKAWQNGLAIVGDLMSAAVVLGGTAMFFDAGYDTIVYFASTMIGFTVMLALVAGPLRRFGRFTFTDVVAMRLSPVPIRIFSAISALAITLLYLVAQMVGAGALIEIMFGIPYRLAVIIVGTLMVIYVAFGGMLATTWVQITKAVLLLSGLTVMTLLVLAQTDFSLNELYTRAADVHVLRENLFQPGGMNMSGIATASLAMGVCFGVIGMPHILMRFFTVPDPATARRSMVVAMAGMFYVHAVIFVVLGAAGVLFISGNPAFVNGAGVPNGGSNMVALHLAAFVGGDLLFGLMAAVVLSTILAVVAGLTVAASAALSHDIYAGVIRRGIIDDRAESIAFRGACLAIGAVAIVVSIAFQGQNIMYLTGLVFSIAASACFPMVLLSLYWRPLTTAGAVSGGAVGLVVSVGTIVLGPSVWVQVLEHPEPILPLDQPAIVSIPAAFIVMIVVSLLTQQREEQPVRAAAAGQLSPDA